MDYLALLPYALAIILILTGFIHALNAEFKSYKSKFIWLALILFIPIIGTLAYLFLGKRSRLNK